MKPRLLAGTPPEHGAETYAEHRTRLGELPLAAARRDLIASLERSGLLGRGGAGFPVGRKMRSVAEHATNGAIVVANGAEGEPRSLKDRYLMTLRPHLVIDGGLLAAAAVGAQEVVLYVGTEHTAAHSALRWALMERGATPLPVTIVEAPEGYVSGESTAVVNLIETGDGRPTDSLIRPHERGVDGKPTLISNVESLAMTALIARFGDEWYRSAGRGQTRGTALVTLTGPVGVPGVHEIEYGMTLQEVVHAGGGLTADVQAVLMGGYFGRWADAREVWTAPMDPAALGRAGHTFGCGLLGLLPSGSCGVTATAHIAAYLAGESARQCGPCIFGLGAIAAALARLAANRPERHDLASLQRWTVMVGGRGACHLPDGAAALVTSAINLFAGEFRLHAESRRCSHASAHVRAA
jgi:NADH:ubiquinone oxidoreductase subunit F (NADH-binding)